MESSHAGIKKSISRKGLLVQGLFFGGALFTCLAILSMVIENVLHQRADLESSVPWWIFALLRAIIMGPGIIVWSFTWPVLSEIHIQIASGIILSGLAGLSLSVIGRKWGIVIFLILYLVMIVLLTLFYMVVSLTG